MKHALVSSRLFNGQTLLTDQAVLISDATIDEIVPRQHIPAHYGVTDLGDALLAPGFIDVQVNGGGGCLLNSQPETASVNIMTAAHRATGTTGLLPTVISDARDTMIAAADAVISARETGNPGILGVHLEGPFLAPQRRGVHSAAAIRPLLKEDIDWLLRVSGQIPTLLTLAPEQLELHLIEQLSEAGVLVCAGHTCASYEQIQAAIQAGLRGFTHLYNAMNPLSAREPGTIAAALTGDCWAGIIADGHHVHPANLQLALRAMPAGKLLLVSDSMSTVGTTDTSFDLYGETVHLQAGKLVNTDGVLAGSAIALADAVRYCHQQLALPLSECLRMASLYPARFLRLDQQLGQLKAGYRADLIALDSKLTVVGTWVAGQAA